MCLITSANNVTNNQYWFFGMLKKGVDLVIRNNMQILTCETDAGEGSETMPGTHEGSEPAGLTDKG